MLVPPEQEQEMHVHLPSTGQACESLLLRLHILFFYETKKPNYLQTSLVDELFFFLAINLLLLLSSHPTHDYSQDVRLQANETGMLF